MIGYRLDSQYLFFDSKRVMAATSRAERRVLSRFGAFVRRTARQSIRKRKGVSQPGRPPSSHAGALKRFIFFVYEPGRKSVVIGPVRLSGRPGMAPRALEHGGRSRRAVRRRGRRTVRVITVRPRPFMGPAMEREKPKLSAIWRDSIR